MIRLAVIDLMNRTLTARGRAVSPTTCSTLWTGGVRSSVTGAACTRANGAYTGEGAGPGTVRTGNGPAGIQVATREELVDLAQDIVAHLADPCVRRPFGDAAGDGIGEAIDARQRGLHPRDTRGLLLRLELRRARLGQKPAELPAQWTPSSASLWGGQGHAVTVPRDEPKWLSPGGYPGQPLAPCHLGCRLRRIGIRPGSRPRRR